MSKAERAIEIRLDGKNCAQAVVGAFAKECNIDENTAIALTAGLGAGCGCKSLCGAANGMAIVIGYHADHELKRKNLLGVKASLITKEYMEKFKERHHYLLCSELKENNCDCNELIYDCAQWAESYLNEIEKDV